MPDGRPWPKISIVTPSYNQDQFIEETIRSVLLQGYPNLEYIIIDGGSTDNSVEIIKKYSPWLTYWVSEPDRGQSHAINKGFSRARGEIFSWLNSDDFLLPRALSYIVEARKKDPSAVAWVGGCYCTTPEGRIVAEIVPRGLERDRMANWGHDGWFFQPSCFFAAWAWQKTEGLDESLHYAMDLDLWIRFAGLGPFKLVPSFLSAAGIHDEAKTQAERSKMDAEISFIEIRHGYREVAMERLVTLLQPVETPLRTIIRRKLGRLARRLGLRQDKRKLLSQRLSNLKFAE
jgi:glycosyltransferase involved in cell wall biosynthesis